MNRNWWTDTSAANWVDYLISWVASGLAAYSCGQAVGSDTVSFLGVGIVSIGILLSYLARALGYHKAWTKAAGPIYCVSAWAAFLGVRFINGMVFEEGTFPIELMPSSWLYWMILFGSFFLWRDGTLIFHLVPALAMFGFVGCYDTFRPVVVLFFVFLVCFAILFARAHARDMQIRAVQSGYFVHTTQTNLLPEEQSVTLQDGPWRWAAGAEWALGSALIIVLLSALGAPVIQAGAKPIAGMIAVRQPNLRNAINRLPATSSVTQDTLKVGDGAVNLTNKPYFEVKGDIPAYLRVATYNTWTGRVWQNVAPTSINSLIRTSDGKDLGEEDEDYSKKLHTPNRQPRSLPDEYRTQSIEVTSVILTSEIPQAGNSPFSNHPRGVRVASDGTVSASVADKYTASVRFDLVESGSGKNAPSKLPGWMASYISQDGLSPLLVARAKEAAKGAKNDFQKMENVREAVTNLIKYNTKVAATPTGKDPAEYACFESGEGYCDVFATAVVEMGRALRIPCRYAIGYLPDLQNRNSVGTQILLESDRHAWAEAFFEGVGWVPFDATTGAEVVPGGDRRHSESSGLTFVQIVGYVLNGLIVVALVVGSFALYKARSAPRTAEVILEELDRAYLTFIGAVWRHTGQRRLLSETTSEYLNRVSEKLTGYESNASKIGAEFTSRMFAKAPPTTEQVAKLQSDVQNFAKQLRAAKK